MESVKLTKRPSIIYNKHIHIYKYIHLYTSDYLSRAPISVGRLLSLPSMTELKKFVRDKHSSLPYLSAMDKLKRFNRLTLRQGNEQLCLQVPS